MDKIKHAIEEPNWPHHGYDRKSSLEFYKGADVFIEKVERGEITKNSQAMSHRERAWYGIFYGKNEPIGITKSQPTGKIEIDRGRHRLTVAKELGWKKIPATVYLTRLSIY